MQQVHKHPILCQSLNGVCNGVHLYQLAGWDKNFFGGDDKRMFMPPTLEEFAERVHYANTKAIMVVQKEQIHVIQFLEFLKGTPTAQKMWLEARRIAPWRGGLADLWMVRYIPVGRTWETSL